MSVQNAHLMTCISGKETGSGPTGSGPTGSVHRLLLGERTGSRLGCSLGGSRTVFFSFFLNSFNLFWLLRVFVAARAFLWVFSAQALGFAGSVAAVRGLSGCGAQAEGAALTRGASLCLPCWHVDPSLLSHPGSPGRFPAQ